MWFVLVVRFGNSDEKKGERINVNLNLNDNNCHAGCCIYCPADMTEIAEKQKPVKTRFSG